MKRGDGVVADDGDVGVSAPSAVAGAGAGAGAARRRVETLRRHLVAAAAAGPPLPRAVCATAAGMTSPTRFKYTLDAVPGVAPVLTMDQRAFYERNGFVVIRGLVTPRELEVYRKRFVSLCKGDAPRTGMMTIMRDVALAKGIAKGVGDGVSGEENVNKIQHYEDDDVLFKYCKNPDILRIVSAIIGPNICSIHTMLINKAPIVGAPTDSSRHPLHQDGHYFPHRPFDGLVCSWTAMQHVHRDNGCLSVIPGSHTGPLLAHGYPDYGGLVNKAYHGVMDLGPDARRVHLEMQAGDTVFFHPLLIHGSGANRTKGYRKAISCHYAAAGSRYLEPEELYGGTQETIAREIEEVARRKGFEGVSYTDVWRAKSRCVAGAEP